MNGIVIVGGNGSGKTTFGQRLGEELNYAILDVEDYYFFDTAIPYSAARTKEEVKALLLADMKQHQQFVFTSVSGDFGEDINSYYDCIIYLDVPLAIRMKRIQQRAESKFGGRVLEGGDMYVQEKAFFDFVKMRKLDTLDAWINTMECPVIYLDGTKLIEKNIEIVKDWIENTYVMNRFQRVEKIDKGWSSDEKYCVVDAKGEKYLLRKTIKEQKERKLQEFLVMQKIAELGIFMCQPLEFFEDDQHVYALQSWIDGRSLDEVLPLCSTAEQYEYGVRAGQMFAQIHTIQEEGIDQTWEVSFNQKIDRKIQLYEECPIKFENGHLFIEYLNQNRFLLKGRPTKLQHGDYHAGNMMVDTGGILYVIDFEKFDYGDPWEEFNRLIFSVEASASFARGMLDGYFNNHIPAEFWPLLALYTVTNIVGSLSWAKQFSEEDVEKMQIHAKNILNWYDNMNQVVPKWYNEHTL